MWKWKFSSFKLPLCHYKPVWLIFLLWNTKQDDNSYSQYHILCSANKNKVIHVWNGIRVSKWWQNFHFQVTAMYCCGLSRYQNFGSCYHYQSSFMVLGTNFSDFNPALSLPKLFSSMRNNFSNYDWVIYRKWALKVSLYSMLLQFCRSTSSLTEWKLRL